MNNINFASPNGFPLEADATLGFMQSDYQMGINALARSMGDNTIIAGVELVNGAYTEGWIYTNGELLHFQGGAPQATCYIAELIVQKANADGTLVNRYHTRNVRFGSGNQQFDFSILKRVNSRLALSQITQSIIGLEDAVILNGCEVSNLNLTSMTLQIDAGLVVIGGKLISVPSYSGVYPVYYSEVGAWSAAAPSNVVSIKFDPYTSQYYRDVLKRLVTTIGEIKMVGVSPVSFDSTGLGRYSWKGFALCNGQNGTLDLRGRTPFAYDERSNNPFNNIWDADYNTVGQTGGQKLKTLNIAEMPEHTHAPANAGYMRRSNSGELVTPVTWDTQGSGSEMNIVQYADEVPKGGGNSFDIRPPYMTLLFVQRI